MWKMMTGTIAESIYNFLISHQFNKKDPRKKVDRPKINY